MVIPLETDKKDNADVALLDDSIVVTPERYPTSEWMQFYIILKRALLFSRRDWVGIAYGQAETNGNVRETIVTGE